MNEGDKQWILDAIRLYDRNHPLDQDSIAMSVTSAKREQTELQKSFKVSSRTGVVKGSQSDRRLGISIPEELFIIIRRRYPNIFSDPANYKWFKKNFPMFVVYR